MKRIYFSVLFSILLIATQGFGASWLCKESASQAEDNIFYACGHYEADTLDVARDISLENAKKEFKKFCDESENCKNQATTITPLRTDCSEVNKKFICDRGLQYTILPQKKSSMMIDRKEIDTLISEKEKELTELRESMKKLNLLSALSSEIEEVKKIDQNEAALAYLKNIKEDYSTPKLRKESVSFSLSAINLPINNPDSSLKSVLMLGLGADASTLIIWNTYLKIGASLLVSGKGKPEANKPNEYYGHFGYDFNLGLAFKISRFHISPTFGITSIKFKSTQQTSRGDVENTYSSKSSYVGIGLRYGDKFFFEIEPRKYFKKNVVLIGIGYSVEF